MTTKTTTKKTTEKRKPYNFVLFWLKNCFPCQSAWPQVKPAVCSQASDLASYSRRTTNIQGEANREFPPIRQGFISNQGHCQASKVMFRQTK